MIETASSEKLLAEAADREKRYQWMEAARVYEHLIGTDATDPAKQTQAVNSLAEAYFAAAFQADTRDEFKQRMALARGAFERAEKLNSQAELPARAQLSEARRIFASYWIEDSLEKRIGLVEAGISTVEQAARTAEEARDIPTLAKAERDDLEYHFEYFALGTNFNFMKDEVEKIVKIADSAVIAIRNGDPTSLLECLFFGLLGMTVSRAELGGGPSAEILQIASQKEEEIKKVAEGIGTPYAMFIASQTSQFIAEALKGEFSQSLKHAEAALAFALQTGNKAMIGRATAAIATSSFWSSVGEEDTEKRRAFLERGRQEASKAARHFKIPLMKVDVANSLEWEAESNTLMITVETDTSRKKEFLRRAIQISRPGLENETYPFIMGSVGHALSKALYYLATLDVTPDEKSQLLEESLRIRERGVKVLETSPAPNTWDRGVNRNYLALIKAELATINPKNEAKVQLLDSACTDMQRCLAICTTAPTVGQIPVVGRYAEWYGDVASKLFELTKSPDASRQAVRAYETAIEYRSKAGHWVSIPNLRWKLARFYDTAGSHEEASKEFQHAAEAYRIAKCPGCDQLFADMATYMDAWSLIEKARLHHSEEQYLLAAEEYQKTSEVLKNSSEWAPLAKHYLGCSYLEGGEALGRQERPDSSKESFQAAIDSFKESTTLLKEIIKAGGNPERINERKEWIDLNKSRERYSSARTLLEEAKLLDKTGNKEASASKYRLASNSFKELMAQSSNDQAKAELETLSFLCEAWGKMKEAEANASPELYDSASKLFLDIEKTARKEKTRVLAMANASICKALEAGTRFRRTRDTELYGDIKKQLETSADYYREAGYKNAADWTRATQRMFDALVYLTEAEVERDPRKKTEHYHLAEKHLQLAAKLYGDAGFQAKKDEALAHLERAREEKALLLSPLDALAGNPVDSAVSVAPVSLVRDQAVGLERFEEASVVGTMRIPAGEVGVGSDLTIELELANIGKTAATLMKLENVSAEGLELDLQKAQLKIEGNFVDLKGKRLEYMKTHDLKIPLRAKRKGSYNLRPRIMFVDERGTYKSYEFEPVALNVKELGISGWLKGPKEAY